MWLISYKRQGFQNRPAHTPNPLCTLSKAPKKFRIRSAPKCVIFLSPMAFFSAAPSIRWLSRALILHKKNHLTCGLKKNLCLVLYLGIFKCLFPEKSKIFLKLETSRKGTNRIILMIRGNMARAPEIIVKVNWTQCTTHCSHLCEINRKIWSMDDWHWLCVNDSKRGEHRKDANCIFGLLMPSSTPV